MFVLFWFNARQIIFKVILASPEDFPWWENLSYEENNDLWDSFYNDKMFRVVSADRIARNVTNTSADRVFLNETEPKEEHIVTPYENSDTSLASSSYHVFELRKGSNLRINILQPTRGFFLQVPAVNIKLAKIFIVHWTGKVSGVFKIWGTKKNWKFVTEISSLGAL